VRRDRPRGPPPRRAPRAISTIPPSDERALLQGRTAVRPYQRPGLLSDADPCRAKVGPGRVSDLHHARSVFRLLVRTIFLPCLVSLTLTSAISPGGMLLTPAANRIRLAAFVDAASLSRTALPLTKKRIEDGGQGRGRHEVGRSWREPYDPSDGVVSEQVEIVGDNRAERAPPPALQGAAPSAAGE
jgi:hypothetical protein